MSEYAIVTDSAADMDAAMAQELGVTVLPLSFTIEDHTYEDHPDRRDMPIETFYAKLRAGKMATTSAVNVAQFTDAIEPLLQAGKDVLVLAFSSGLSTTYNSSAIAVEELRERYPERKVFTVDTLCASMGQALLVWHAVRLQREGKTIEEVRDWAEANKLQLCHWVAVDDLAHLKRGGRISATTAFVGGMLSIKPIIHVDDEGHLINVGKVRGRRASLERLVDELGKRIEHPEDQTIFISHSDCLEDAKVVGEGAKARFGVKDVVYGYIGPVIGAHTGPGTVALFFLGTER
ncbi:DegV family protein [Pseudoflavonifractor sp. MSJ-37]|uniref:DegV family protein n=1 Tax=Pseudoflavonifractor sp. MSJ-37 TaxID=2841531 RepID=UPI001C126C1B|nr:DegV family protein [Pseudoflavonifractor sp. MSJ-37]MBU5435191.1 DegV family protein [Pseudoflavonifractor sp. MSJ-37]